MNIKSQRMFNADTIAAYEDEYDAKYVIDSCLVLTNGNFADQPAAFFYADEAHPVSKSRYFAIFFDKINEQMMITNGESINGRLITFVVAKDGALIHSAYCHDCQTYKDVMIDGGMDYTRCGFAGEESTTGVPDIKMLLVKDGELVCAEI